MICLYNVVLMNQCLNEDHEHDLLSSFDLTCRVSLHLLEYLKQKTRIMNKHTIVYNHDQHDAIRKERVKEMTIQMKKWSGTQ